MTSSNSNMPYYHWTGLSRFGKKIKGEMQAKNAIYVKVKLRLQGITPLKISKKFSVFTKKVDHLSIALFCRQLSTLLKAGIPLFQACRTLQDTQENPILKNCIHFISQEIASGKNLSQSMRQFPKYFDVFTCNLIQLGEKTGKLELSLFQVSQYKEKSIALKKQIVQALFYPAMVTLIAIAVTLIMLIFIVPKFSELFHSMNHPLPLFTQIVIFISNLLCDYGWLFLFPLIIASGLLYYFRDSKTLQKKKDTLILKIPIVKTLLQKSLLARLTRNLATTFSAGIPILEALGMLSANTSHFLYSQAIKKLESDVASGRQLHKAMQANSLFPTLMVQMIKVGEESGMLENMLEKISELYESDIDHFIAYLKQLLEPLIMAILGVLIGGLVIAMYLPIFKLGTVI